jgi:hypothetical protein
MKEKKPKYYLDTSGEFVIENYNCAKPFASFFPGIAGKYGIPMWAFYVNRGQGIVSLGTRDKDHAILEFFPANKAWQLASLQGFRTFIKLNTGKTRLFYEPFHNGFANSGFNLANKMSITSHNFKIEETNLTLGLNIKVEYFTIPQEPYAALVRTVSIRNTAKSKKRLQIIDGLPQIIPFGISNLFLKKLGRTIEAWMKVENLKTGVPFYKIDVDPTDRPQVIHIHQGHFYLSYLESENPKIIRPIVDPQCVFGPVSDFSCPQKFIAAKNFPFPQNEITQSKTPSALSLLNIELGAGEEKTFYSLTGYMPSLDMLNSYIPKIIKPGYLADKKEESKKLITALQSDIATSSGSLEFDLYAKQTYLDNILRGGYPLLLDAGKSKAIFYLYSRKHGDLERDYNKFQLEATYFSQGNGNYRDVNQNRRCDVWFNPEIKDINLTALLNLIQADGFNPLVVKGARFMLNDPTALKNKLKGQINEGNLETLLVYLEKPFTPGDLIIFIQKNEIKLKVSYDELLNIVLNYSANNQEAEHGEGFWIDHWTYNLDLLESYLGIYPENFKQIVFTKKIFTFYDNTETVRPRCKKYTLLDGAPRQLHSLFPDSAKREMIKQRQSDPHLVRADYGLGAIYQTTLLNKLLCILANKLASLDPSGAGIEMEADKPGWYDALNGLPALFGSSINETLELKRLAIFIKKALKESGIDAICVTEEILDFLNGLAGLLEEWLKSGSDNRNFQYWDKSYSLKEFYRQKTCFGFSGKEIPIGSKEIIGILDKALKKIGSGIEKAKPEQGRLYYSYFINEVIKYDTLKDGFIRPTKFKQKPLPLFLEAQMHALRLAENKESALGIYKATRKSPLYDKKLKMYKVTASLKEMPEEIGRCRVFTPGWLENESIWLHMEYKYLLEILKSGLNQEFYADFKKVLIPFQDPQTYGRSILENSSFLVSSAFPDKSLHGNGYVARLSGSTAEFLSLWLLLNLGREPFFLNAKKELNLRFRPILAGWLFNKKDSTYRFNFLSKISVIYHNPKRKNTFGKKASTVKKIVFTDAQEKLITINSDTLPHPYAEQVRARQVKILDIFLG